MSIHAPTSGKDGKVGGGGAVAGTSIGQPNMKPQKTLLDIWSSKLKNGIPGTCWKKGQGVK